MTARWKRRTLGDLLRSRPAKLPGLGERAEWFGLESMMLDALRDYYADRCPGAKPNVDSPVVGIIADAWLANAKSKADER